MKSEVEKLIRQKWYLKSASEKTMKARLACKCDGKEYVANLKFNEMFDQFDIGDNNEPIVSEILAEETWWNKVRPILDGDTKEVGEGLTRKWFVPVTFKFTHFVDVVAESAEEAKRIVKYMHIDKKLEGICEESYDCHVDDTVTLSINEIKVAEYGDAEEDD